MTQKRNKNIQYEHKIDNIFISKGVNAEYSKLNDLEQRWWTYTVKNYVLGWTNFLSCISCIQNMGNIFELWLNRSYKCWNAIFPSYCCSYYRSKSWFNTAEIFLIVYDTRIRDFTYNITSGTQKFKFYNHYINEIHFFVCINI